jgi:hypothetical protein
MKKASGRGAVPSTKSNDGLFNDDFRTSKKDKRTIKHSSFISKIEKSSKKAPKRRRASKKLATLDSLADALPDADTEEHQQDPNSQINIIKQKTLKHKPGAEKRRQKLEKLERDRFARNMAQMTAMDTSREAAAPITTTEGTSSTATEADGTTNRWAALRSFISQTMEQQPVFKANK